MGSSSTVLTYKKSGPVEVALFMMPVAGLDLHFRPGMGENKGVAAVETGGKQRSSALHLNGFEPSTNREEKRQRISAVFFLGAGGRARFAFSPLNGRK